MKRLIIILLLFALLCGISACGANAFGGNDSYDVEPLSEPFVISLDGKSIGDYSICLAPDSPVDLKNAAESLRLRIYVQTGFKLPIVTTPAEYNLRIVVTDIDPDISESYFSGCDLFLTGGHYLSAAKAAYDFAASLTDDLAIGSDYKISSKFDSVPLMNERYRDMQLVWNDEFDFDGDLYDRRKWVQSEQMVASDVYNSKQERNVMSSDGKLILRTWSEDGGKVGKPYSTSMSMTTFDSLNYCYGYLEMRAIVPFGQGVWPSFWMLSKPEYSTEDYKTEIDIFEVFSSVNSLAPNLHKWYHTKSDYHAENDSYRIRQYVFKNAEKLSEEFHTYGFYWDEQKMVFSVDGEDYCSFDITEKGDFGNIEGMGGFHVPCYIIINNFLFSPEIYWKPDNALVDDSTTYPITYTIDYIRLYQGENGILYKPSDSDDYKIVK